MNGQLVNSIIEKAWRILIAILLAIFGFLGSKIYNQVYENIPATYVQQAAFEDLREDIRDVRKAVEEINCYLRDNPRAQILKEDFSDDP